MQLTTKDRRWKPERSSMSLHDVVVSVFFSVLDKLEEQADRLVDSRRFDSS